MNNWYTSEILPLNKPLISREEFVRLYLPEYVKEYRPNYGIRTYIHKVTKRLMVARTTPGSIKAQVTKRNNRIDAQYAEYLRVKNSQMEIDRRAAEPLLNIS